MSYRFTTRVLPSIQERNQKIIWLQIATSLKTRLELLIEFRMPPTRRYTRLRPMPEDGVRQSLFLPASDYALVGKPTLTIGLESVIFFLSILIIVGVLAQIAHDVYIIATFVLYPFWLTFHVILSPFVTLTQGLNILLRAILHVFVCIFTAIGTFIWLNIFSISLFLWFRNTLSATFFSKIDEVEDDTNGKLISMQI